jgi:hypothetical protein
MYHRIHTPCGSTVNMVSSQTAILPLRCLLTYGAALHTAVLQMSIGTVGLGGVRVDFWHFISDGKAYLIWV